MEFWRSAARLLPVAALSLALGTGMVGCTTDSNEDGDVTGTGWTGTLSASVNGLMMNFNDIVWMEPLFGGDVWVIGNDGTRQLQFYVPMAQAGTYTTSGGGPMGRFVPDTSVLDFDYTNPEGQMNSLPGGIIELSQASATRIVGSFSFVVTDMTDTLVISNGIIDLTEESHEAPGAPIGAWQRTVPGEEQQSFELVADGTFHEVFANFQFEFCESGSGTFAVDGDSIRVSIGGEGGAAAWARNGSTLTLYMPGETEPQVFSSVSALPSCEDYGFESSTTGWAGTLTATVDGVATDFGSVVWLEEIGGGDAWVIGNAGIQQLQFYVATAVPGTYATSNGEAGMGRYVPDTSVPGYDYSMPAGEFNTNFDGGSGSISVTQATPTSFTGSFAFEVGNGSGGSVSITNGVVDIHAVEMATPAGFWQTDVPGVFEETLAFTQSGDYHRIHADFSAEQCSSETSVYTTAVDSLHIGTGVDRVAVAWSMNAGQLVLDFPTGASRTYQPVGGLPDCDSYGFDAPASPVGIWQLTVEDDFEETLSFNESGSHQAVLANFIEQACMEASDIWSFDETNIYIGVGLNRFTLGAWSIDDDMLTLVFENETSQTYHRIDAVPTCDDYVFGSDSPVGIWQLTEAGTFEESYEFTEDGGFTFVYASLLEEYCEAHIGTWSQDGNAIHVLEENGSTRDFTFEVMDNTLYLTREGFTQSYPAVDMIPTCEDYGFDPLAQLYGIWQRGNPGTFEETISFQPGNAYQVFVADLREEYCFVVNGTYELDGDSLRIDYIDGFGPPAYAWNAAGTSLVLSAPGYGDFNYESVLSMPDCGDYGFEDSHPIGIWQTGGSDWEYTLAVADIGTFLETTYFTTPSCDESAGTWTASADSIFFSHNSMTVSVAFQRMGNLLRLTYQDGYWQNLFAIDEPVTCADYGLARAPGPWRETRGYSNPGPWSVSVTPERADRPRRPMPLLEQPVR